MAKFTQNDTSKRFLKVFEWLTSNNTIINKSEFCKKVGFLPQSLTKVLNGERGITVEFISKLVTTYGINPVYLHTGNGDIFISKEYQLTDSGQPSVVEDGAASYFPSYQQPKTGFTFIPFFDILNNKTEGTGIYLPNHLINIASPKSIQVVGNEMSPTIFTGDWAIVEKIESSHWGQFESDGVFVIITKTRQLHFRRVTLKHNESIVILIADNRDKLVFPDIHLSLNDIHEIWKVKWHLTDQLPNIYKDVSQRINSLENGIEQLNKELSSLKQNLKS
jgi:phage repressor protein C with HTH and peptisase S24 domain